jgi:hypothetical protein
MLALRYLLMILGIGFFGSASALVAYDIFLATQLRRLLQRKTKPRAGSAWAVPYEIGLPGIAAGQGLR